MPTDWAAVIPSNRPERLASFQAAWKTTFLDHDVTVYVVNDEPSWTGIPSWIPRRTDMIRSWGIYQAWLRGHKWIVSLDDDVLPIPKVDIFEQYETEFGRKYPVSPYLSVGALTSFRGEMRGFPANARQQPVGIQYGGWEGVPDLDAETQIAHPEATRETFARVVLPVPRDVAVTTCAMNFAFHRDYAAWCWQLPLYQGRYNRWGDIWSGLIQKRLCDLYGVAMLVNGRASVSHDRASDPAANRERERPGHAPHRGLWEAVRRSGPGFVQVTDALGQHIGLVDPEWRSAYLRARDAWWSLFDV